MTYVVINEDIYPTNTTDEIDAAKAAMREAGLAQTPVYVGDPDGAEGDSYANGLILFALGAGVKPCSSC